MRQLTKWFLCLAILSMQPVIASPATQALSNCFADHTTGKDRKELARWIFLAISVHPEIRNLSSATTADRTESNKRMAELVTRLLVKDCVTETRAAIKNGGQEEIGNAFKPLGALAMQELMSDKEVTANIANYVQYVDLNKLNSVLQTR